MGIIFITIAFKNSLSYYMTRDIEQMSFPKLWQFIETKTIHMTILTIFKDLSHLICNFFFCFEQSFMTLKTCRHWHRTVRTSGCMCRPTMFALVEIHFQTRDGASPLLPLARQQTELSRSRKSCLTRNLVHPVNQLPKAKLSLGSVRTSLFPDLSK